MPSLEYVTLKEAAESLGVDRSTVQRWITRGDLAAQRLGTGRGIAWLVHRDDLDQLINRRQPEEQTP